MICLPHPSLCPPQFRPLRDRIQNFQESLLLQRRFKYDCVSALHVVLLHESVQMSIAVRGDHQRLREAATAITGAVVAINGSFGDPNLSSYEQAERGPRPRNEYKMSGEMIAAGELVQGDPNSNGAFLALTADHRYRFGQGRLSSSIGNQTVVAGLSALIPMILNCRKFGDNNATYSQINSRLLRPNMGRVIVGYNPDKHWIAVIVQEHRTSGVSLDYLRDFAYDIGCNNAVGLDGSDSAMLWIQKRGFIVINSVAKNNVCANAVVFHY